MIGEFWRFLLAMAGLANGTVGWTLTRVDADDFPACDYVIYTLLGEKTRKNLIGESLQLSRRVYAE